MFDSDRKKIMVDQGTAEYLDSLVQRIPYLRDRLGAIQFLIDQYENQGSASAPVKPPKKTVDPKTNEDGQVSFATLFG